MYCHGVSCQHQRAQGLCPIVVCGLHILAMQAKEDCKMVGKDAELLARSGVSSTGETLKHGVEQALKGFPGERQR